MPTYEFVCVKCGEEFVRVMSITEYASAKPACPKCGGDAKQQMSEFIAKTSRKS
jgi:putative FmdB family regulatory protein